MQKLYKVFASPLLALILLMLFAIAMATATFVENDFGTPTAWAIIYDSWWFELIMVGLALCFVANIFKYRLFRKEKWSMLLFHLAFIIIILGAAITRYTSEGGVMRIREGEQSSTIISDKTFLRIHLTSNSIHHDFTQPLKLIPLQDPYHSWNTEIDGQPLEVRVEGFIPDAETRIVDDQEHGKPMIEMVVSKGQGRETLLLEYGETEILSPSIKVGFEVDSPGVVNIQRSEEGFTMTSPTELDFFIMAQQVAGKISTDSVQPMQLRTLYRKGDISFVPLNYHPNGRIDFISTSEKPGNNEETKDDIVQVTLQLGEEEVSTNLLFRSGFLPVQHPIAIGPYTGHISYGSDAINLPFALYLEDFQLERYPGSTSPSSYASEVRIIEGEQQENYNIHMNHVLDHRGYRFYQASYDTDELGTVLAVNKDRPGTYITYLGYLLMGLGMFLTLFGKGSHFWVINKKLKKLKRIGTAIVALIAMQFAAAQSEDAEGTIAQNIVFPIEQAENFSRVLVQDLDGRIKPLNSLASEFLRKISRKNYLELEQSGNSFRLTPDQVFLSMQMYPEQWRTLPLIKVDSKKLSPVTEELPEHPNELVAFNDLLEADGSYILSEAVEKANLKKPAERNETDKELIKVDERFNIVFGILQGDFMKIFPNKNDENDTWFATNHHFQDFSPEDARFAKNVLPLYFLDIHNGDYAEAFEKARYIKTYQETLAADIIPGEKKINAELLYNDLNINFWMFQFLFTIGAVLLVLAITFIFKTNKFLKVLWNGAILITLVGFLVFTGNLILRWYIGGHAPWSNGYEMLVFVAWVLLLCGFLTFRKSDFALPLATLFSGALLFVSYLDWLNPEITNLMPVLKSYWLKVHVATIVSSYAPLALSAVLGIMVLILMIIRTPSIAGNVDKRIKELTYINEISMTIGLFVLAVGTFLGGVWANESWGRYWAWDPKETWALISIIIYSVVLHLRLIPKLHNPYVVNASSMFAFWSIIMTSFGVNYYLSGLHSYAAGDPMPVPTFVYVIAALMILLSVMAWFRFGKKVTLRL
ncbi:cytochrome c biogenesis protein [Robertkochia sediminum]|uniref:cytochrome c biogenesis protein n=1 Tax=Robertkochia sediminum TaxID=2785326 RepID=UPI0019329A15|nr:cytochrome c biogenesis protein CcsA [Robertkochia sediminum]MBL7471535.1 cytochrome c biogenesis protein CcsA [Robertkochia sediminum]